MRLEHVDRVVSRGVRIPLALTKPALTLCGGDVGFDRNVAAHLDPGSNTGQQENGAERSDGCCQTSVAQHVDDLEAD
jgi:hypothetical protein